MLLSLLLATSTPALADPGLDTRAAAQASDEGDSGERMAKHVRGGNRLSKRAQRRYEDVLTTHDGSRWRGKIFARGDVYRIRLEDGSEVAVPQADVASVTRELIPGYPHTGQWGVRAALGGEAAIVASDTNAGIQYGALGEFALTRNFQGPFEPELILLASPLGPEDGKYSWQVALGTRYYLGTRRAKPFTFTELVLAGSHGDLGLRTGPGFMFDVSPNFGIGVSQGVTLMSQKEPKATGVGYHILVSFQGRF